MERTLKMAWSAAAAAALFCTAPHDAHAHHPVRNSQIQTRGNATRYQVRVHASAQTSVWTRYEYLQLVDLPPSYQLPMGSLGDRVFTAEFGGSIALSERVEMMASLPLVSRQPQSDDRATQRALHIGDIQLGSRFFAWMSQPRSASLSIGWQLTFPSGGVRPFTGSRPTDDLKEPEVLPAGAGVFVNRLSTNYLHRLGPFMLQGDAGLSWSYRHDASVMVDYGASAAWSPFTKFGCFIGAHAQTYLQTDGYSFSSQQAQMREQGESLVILNPGIWLSPMPPWTITIAPTLPLTKAKDFDWSLAGSMAWSWN